MKATLNRNTLLLAMENVRHTADGRRHHPGLENAWLQARNGFIEITGHNIQQTITHTIPALVHAEGGAAVPANMLCELARHLPDQAAVELDWNEQVNRLKVTCGKSTSNIAGTNPENYPETARHEAEGSPLRLDPVRFRAAMTAVAPAIAATEDRPVLNHMLLQAQDGRFKTAAADGFRLMLDGGPLAEPTAEPVEALIPAKAVQDLTRLLARTRDTLQTVVSTETNRITFRCAGDENGFDTVYTSSLNPGKFPDVEPLVPRQWDSRVTIPMEQAAGAAREMRAMSRHSSQVTRFIMGDGPDDELIMKTGSPDMGAIQVSVPVVNKEGQPFRMAFNNQFILDITQGSEALGLLVIETGAPQQPGVFRDTAREAHLSVVMPMSILWDDNDTYPERNADESRTPNDDVHAAEHAAPDPGGPAAADQTEDPNNGVNAEEPANVVSVAEPVNPETNDEANPPASADADEEDTAAAAPEEPGPQVDMDDPGPETPEPQTETPPSNSHDSAGPPPEIDDTGEAPQPGGYPPAPGPQAEYDDDPAEPVNGHHPDSGEYPDDFPEDRLQAAEDDFEVPDPYEYGADEPPSRREPRRRRQPAAAR